MLMNTFARTQIRADIALPSTIFAVDEQNCPVHPAFLGIPMEYGTISRAAAFACFGVAKEGNASGGCLVLMFNA